MMQFSIKSLFASLAIVAGLMTVSLSTMAQSVERTPRAGDVMSPAAVVGKLSM